MYLFHQIAREIVSLLVNNLHEKPSQRVKTDKILKEFRLFAICNLQFALVSQLCTRVVHKNALDFSQSEAHNFSCTLLT